MSDRLVAALSAIVGPDAVVADRASLTTYESDAFGLVRGDARAVVLPRSTDEVSRVVALCHREHVPVVPRGAGTGLSGGAAPVDGGVIVETARMKRILSIDAAARLAVVQPGVANAVLSAAARPHGLVFGPDPSSGAVCTLGGNAAENAGGPHALKHGLTTQHVLGLEVVLANGEVVNLGGAVDGMPGYDLVGLFVGSEGLLGVTTALTVRLSPLAPETRTLLVAFPSLVAGCEAVGDLIEAGLEPSALEALDRGTIATIEASAEYAAGYPLDAELALLVDLDGTAVEVERAVAEASRICRARGATEIREGADESSRRKLWKGRKSAFGAMGRLRGDVYVLDGTVPRSALPRVLAFTVDVAARYGLTICNVFHAGDGNLHPNISFDGRDPDMTRRALAAGAEILRACVDAGGSITGEHGVGVEKLSFMHWMFGERELAEMEALKRLVDPSLSLNPGKLIPSTKGCAEAKGKHDLVGEPR
ncbi:MAG: FAD-binding protein [Deltaproteobacteria bacterium]|nr:FAD-binding protein [Deltaproteobacteria bacterium]